MAESVTHLGDSIYQLAPRTGTSFSMNKGQRLTVVDPRGCQVADLLAFNAADINEVISNGRTFDYAQKIYLTTGDKLYSNRSNVLLTIGTDTSGRNDFLMTPCSKDTFRIHFNDPDPVPGCFGNFAHALERHGIEPDRIPVPFNVFMNVPVDGNTGRLTIKPPITKPGDYVEFVAEMDVIIGLTACSAGRTNAGTFKPINYFIE